MTCKDCINEDYCKSMCSVYYDHLSQECEMFCRNKICEHRYDNADKNCKGFKDKSKIIELPCKVGDKIYILNRNKTKVQEMVLDKPDIRCHCNEEHNLCMALCPDTKNGICAHRFNNDFREIGKTVFLTRDEAETKLKELNGQ